MFNRFLDNLGSAKPAYIILVSVLSAVLITLIIVSSCSIFFYGRITYEFLVTGVIAAFIVASIVVVLVINVTARMLQAKIKSELEFKSLEKNIADIIKKTSDIFYRTDNEGKIVWISQSVFRVMGYTPEEVIGKDMSSYYANPEERIRFRQLLEENNGAVRNFEAKMRKKDGSEVWLSTDASYWHDNLGSVAGVEGETRDITPKKEIENALRASEEQYRTLIENIQEGVFLLQGGKFVYLNNRFVEMADYKVSDLIGREFAFLIAEEDRARVLKHYTKRLDGEDVPKEYEFRLNHRDGKTRVFVHMQVSLTEYRGKVATAGTIVNISEKRRMETFFHKAQKLESVGLLAGGIAHDFNNLLTSILGGLSLIKLAVDKGGDEEDIQIVGESINATKRAKDLARQLLAFSKGAEPVKTLVDLKVLLKESVTFALRGSESSFEMDIADNLWDVEADEGQINQVINNLVINAEQAMPEGGKIEVYAYNVVVASDSGIPMQPGKYIQFTIKDTGHGIPNEYIDKIFDPYFTSKQKGSGLGLASTYSIVRNHGGIIDVESELGKGSKFHVFLPASEAKAIERSAHGPLMQGNGRILVMDDEDVVRNILGRMLKKLGYETEFAINGEEAVSIYKDNFEKGLQFQLIITDLTIPGGMGGEKVVKILKDVDPSLKAIATSGYALDPIMSNYAEYGFSGILQKPFDVETLSVALEKVLAEKSRDA